MIRIVIIEGQALLRLGLVNAISQSPMMEVCGEVACAAEGIELVAKTLPDIVIINISLPDMGGIEATIAIKQRFDCKVVILTDQDDEEIVALALSAGADSYLLSTSEPEILRYAIVKTKEGECWIDPKLSKNFLTNNNKAKEEKSRTHKGKNFRVTLTTTELRTLKFMACGLSNEQIAELMNVTEGTVKSYVHLVNKKLQAYNRPHAVMRGVKLGYFNYNTVICEVLGNCPQKRYQPS
ncbi:response regulator transcription factor [Komarekiella sp. 'clone 1']|uniref:Response regulator transcription factor n=1 Tax=Komarekiella delphini-convector SJRDD-AB1 TaxID=2593771 RepID=A0AA40T467_9NOST|nr:response regulator transcription factor [Komarekiella delphini-convector]MBD6620350.1 response regulator transcription factor [Komarekiella delphini-convector SJRDD-AB1]